MDTYKCTYVYTYTYTYTYTYAYIYTHSCSMRVYSFDAIRSHPSSTEKGGSQNGEKDRDRTRGQSVASSERDTINSSHGGNNLFPLSGGGAGGMKVSLSRSFIHKHREHGKCMHAISSLQLSSFISILYIYIHLYILPISRPSSCVASTGHG